MDQVEYLRNLIAVTAGEPKDASSFKEQAAVKIPAMVGMCIITFFFGNLPLRMKAFKENQLVLALANGFSGGLFLSVGLLHLLPEANEDFENYYNDDEDHFPWAFLITVLSFALILFIEKMITGDNHHHHHHNTKASMLAPNASQNRLDIKNNTVQAQSDIDLATNDEIKQKLLENVQNQEEFFVKNENNESQDKEGETNVSKDIQIKFDDKNDVNGNDSENEKELEEAEEEIVSRRLNIKKQLALSFKKEEQQQGTNQETDWTPYILQIAVGIHATFEGIAIGIETQWSQALGIALAVVFHKWAEALTLGISFRNANVEINRATLMIFLQAIMNPIGIGLGWIMSSQGYFWTGVFTSISVGTFVYIATMEVLVEEFSLKRHKWAKFGLFLIAIPFVSMLWVLEQITED